MRNRREVIAGESLRTLRFGNCFNIGGVKGHQTLTSCCDLNIDRREKNQKFFLLEMDSSTTLYKENLKNSFFGNDLDLPRKPEVEFEPTVWLP